MEEKEKPILPYILSLIGGVFILIGGLWTMLIGIWGLWGWRMMHRMTMGWWFIAHYGLMLFRTLGLIGIISGVIVIISAIMLNSRPEEHLRWGTLILVFSILSIFSAMGGFLIGLIFGIIGGIMAISWKPGKQF